MASRLYGYFLMAWRYGKVTQEQLQAAVEKGYLTEQEYQEIISTPQDMVVSSASMT